MSPHGEPRNEDDGVASDTTMEEEYDNEMLWTVEDVLAEVPAQPGTGTASMFLIQWTGFELYDATWEPEDHLEPATIVSWEETKDAIERGQKAKFEVGHWWGTRAAHLRGRLDRARLRDAKKLARGKPISENAAKLEQILADHLSMEAEFYGSEESEGDSDSDVNEDVLPPPRAFDSTGRPPPVQQTQQPEPTGPQRRKPIGAQKKTTGAEKGQTGATGSTETLITGASRSPTEQQPKQSLQQAVGGKKRGPPSTTPSTKPRVVQSPKQVHSAAPKPKPNVLKAKRTVAAGGLQSAGSNIFTSGKIARKRRNLSEIMGDPSRENKFFQKHRIARIAHKRSRDKEDRPPPTVSSKLFDISKGPESRNLKGAEGDGQTTVNRQEIPSALAKRGSTDDGVRGAESQKKRKKSVTFCDATVEWSPPPNMPDSSPQPVPMDLDDLNDMDSDESINADSDEPGLFVPRRPPSPVRRAPEADGANPISLTLLTTKENTEPVKSIPIKKLVSFGPEGSKIEVSLEGIPDTPGEAWSTDLLGCDHLSFTHTCVAQDLKAQKETIVGDQICAGYVKSVTASQALENVASRLMLGSFGAVCFRDGYTVVMYPRRCNQWKTGVFDIGATISPSDVDLGYFIFFTKGADGNPPHGPVQELEPAHDKSLADRQVVWERIIGFHYKSLLPKAWVDGKELGRGRHAFFLLFPPSRTADLDSMILYLRSCDPQCFIYTIKDEGSWDYLLKTTAFCTIIIHEASVSALRMLKGVFQLMPIADSRATFWRFGEAMTAHSGIPLGESDRWVPPGKITLHRILPGGKAILLTPSFLLAQPHRAVQFLTWYSDNIARSRHARTNKIIVAHDACDYLQDIADQNWRAHRRARGYSRRSTDEARGASFDECQAMETALITLRDLFDASRCGGPMDEDLAPIICAPENLGPADEQSLVNWFGWWSMVNLDAYRCFIVLGTDEVDIRDCPDATFVTSLPTYYPDTINDPEWHTGGSGPSAEHPRGTAFPCRRLPDDNPTAITAYLESLNHKYNIPYKTHIVLYKFPVGFSSAASRSNAPDYHHDLQTFQAWFGYLRPFRPTNNRWSKLVYGGLFYTAAVVEESDSNKHAEVKESHHHPWLAFYRPARPHLLPQGRHDGQYELVIWDWTAPSKLPGNDTVTEDKLLVAQRQLIDFISKNTAAKNPGSILETVWVGGHQSAPTLQAHPLDVTIDFLEDVMEDTKIMIPATGDQLRGVKFRKVVPPSLGTGSSSPKHGQMEEGVVYRDIFHPPRGNGSVHPSRCKNILFEQAQQALQDRQVGRDRKFSYKFEPTSRWYQQQRKEGRSFEHMLVGVWKAGFDVLRIDQRTKDGESAGSPESLT